MPWRLSRLVMRKTGRGSAREGGRERASERWADKIETRLQEQARCNHIAGDI